MQLIKQRQTSKWRS